MNAIPPPIACAFHDQLELRALRRQRCRLVLRNAAGREIVVETIIEDLNARTGREFAWLANGWIVPLDRIRSVDDIQA